MIIVRARESDCTVSCCKIPRRSEQSLRILLRVVGKHTRIQVEVYRPHAVFVDSTQRLELSAVGKTNMAHVAQSHPISFSQSWLDANKPSIVLMLLLRDVQAQ